MKMFMKLAWRNVLRNKRRSLITFVAIALGLGILIHYSAFTSGFKEQMTDNSVRMYIMGHILIHEKGFHDEPAAEKFLPDAEKIMAEIRKSADYRHVRGMTARVKFQGLLSSPTNSYGVLAVGITPDSESTVTLVHRTMISGKFLEERQEDAHSIVIGEKLAKALKVAVGEKIVLMAQASDGSMGAEALRIKGIFRSSNPDLDRSVTYLPLKTARNILAYDNGVSEVALLLDHSNRAEAIQADLRKTLPQSVETLNWRELSPDLVAMMDMFDLDVIIVMVIIYVLVGVSILNTLLMAIMERLPEFGVLNAVGMKPSRMVQLILLEAFFIGSIGVFFGTLLGLADVAVLSRHGIDFSAFSEGLGRFLGMQTTIYSRFSWKGTLGPMFFVMAAVMAAALYPALKAARLQPMEAIRHL